MPADRGGFPSGGGAALPSFSLIPVRKIALGLSSWKNNKSNRRKRRKQLKGRVFAEQASVLINHDHTVNPM